MRECCDPCRSWDGAALAALKQWRYTPTLLNSVPVRVLLTITFNFRLGDRVP